MKTKSLERKLRSAHKEYVPVVWSLHKMKDIGNVRIQRTASKIANLLYKETLDKLVLLFLKILRKKK